MPTATKTSTRKKPVEDMTIPNRNNRFLSLLSLVTPFLLMPVVAIVAGHVALKEYNKENADQTWKPLALAGTISGYIVLFIKINILMAIGASIASQAGYSHYNHDMYSYDMPMHSSSDKAYPQSNKGYANTDGMEEYMMGGNGSNSMMGSGSAVISEDGTITFVDGIKMPAEMGSPVQ